MHVNRMSPWLKTLHSASLALVLVVPAGIVHAQVWPVKPIRLVIGYTPGGAAEGTLRTFSQKLEAILGQQLVVEYKPGAGATIGADFASKSAPDGYTLHLIDNGPLTIVPAGKKLGYDPLKSFTFIGLVNVGGTVLMGHPSVQANTLDELLKIARAKPGSLSYGTSGIGGTGHMSGELFKSVAKLDVVHIPYKGGGPAMAELLGGQIPLLFSSLTPAVPHIKAGKLRAYAVTSLVRSSAIPDVPTIAELGYPGFEAVTYFGLVGPAGLPKDIVTKTSDALLLVLKDKEVQEAIKKQGYEPMPTTGEVMAERVRTDLAKWTKVIKDVGITLE
ncbi:MAG: tripartite tricarboxylate transporter substrate binding protein [Betaproteobacteria bacterium]|nr:tripartite tricarboxylate transporter substrate binding protein [Betaproteobacteria bacterium]